MYESEADRFGRRKLDFIFNRPLTTLGCKGIHVEDMSRRQMCFVPEAKVWVEDLTTND